MARLIDAELLTSKISFTGFPHTDRNGRIDKSWVYELINSCPTVEERPQGEWIKKVDDVGFVSYICSECASEIEVEDCSDDKFCFNCGAEMREADNENSN